MDVMYQSLGGDGYISPGRRSYHPSTDLRDNQHQHRLARCSLATLTFLTVVVSVLAAFFFFPRPLYSSPSGSGSSASYFTLSDQQQLSFTFNHTVSITNNNYYPLPVHSALLTFTLPPLPPNPPLPSLCSTPRVLGTYEAGSTSVSALQTSDWQVSGVVSSSGGGEAALCMREWCVRSGGYDVWMDALVRVSYVQLQAALVADTVVVSVQCPIPSP